MVGAISFSMRWRKVAASSWRCSSWRPMMSSKRCIIVPCEKISAPSLAGQVPLPPRVEHQQGPQDLLMIPGARDMLGHERGRRARIEESYPSDLPGIQSRLERFAQSSAHPYAQGNAEALLAAVQDYLGNEATQRTLEDMLCPPTLQLERRGDAARELNERTVEEWCPHLESAGHARAVHHHEVLLREVELAMLVDQRIESVQTRQAGSDHRYLVERINLRARGAYRR